MARKRVLLVDDDESVRTSLRLCIEAFEIDVFEAVDGLIAFDFLREHRVDFILSDINMPRMNGLLLATAIRKFGLETPMVLITGNPTYKKADALRSGANDLMEKPFETIDVLKMIDLYVAL
ncbi:MAG: response regulator [Bdellovibrionales bacterium]|nr:response regulator [Bdellovibrionales bacterium]